LKQVKLRLIFNIARLQDETFDVSLVSVDQGGAEIPATAVQFTPPNLHLEWKAIGGSYDGQLTGGKLTGKFRQGGGALPLTLTRTAAK
jgi:hypothetical protein